MDVQTVILLSELYNIDNFMIQNCLLELIGKYFLFGNKKNKKIVYKRFLFWYTNKKVRNKGISQCIENSKILGKRAFVSLKKSKR